MGLIPGFQAPDFVLRDQYGIAHQLSHYRGTWIILFFLPNDYFTSCVKELCAIRDDFALIQDRQAELFSVNLDTKKNHAQFAERHKLTFPMLIDSSAQVCEQYDVLGSWGPVRWVRRQSVIINPTGNVCRIYRKPKSPIKGSQLVNDLDLLRLTFKPTHITSLA